MMQGEISFEAPGEGPWELDASHFDRPLPRYGFDRFAAGFETGQARWLERVGAPLKTIRIAAVHGVPYGQPQPLFGSPADMAKPPPPLWVMKLLMWVHPGMRRRRQAAERWFSSRGWRDDLERWDGHAKPGLLSVFAALEAERPDGLDDAALLDHLVRCGDAVEENLGEHMDTNALLMPVGAFLWRGLEWTGLSAVELLEAVRGTGARGPLDEALSGLAGALRGDADGAALLNGGRAPAEAIEALRQHDGDVGQAARAWLSLVEHRSVSGIDVTTPLGAEVPAVLLDQVRRALEAPVEPRALEAVDADALCAGAPAERREELRFWLDEARRVYRVRDERSNLCDCWVTGLMRRALLEAGGRLVERGALQKREHVVDLEHAELDGLLRGGSSPSADEVAARAAARAALRIEDAPPLLNLDERPPDPPFDQLGGALGEILKAVLVYRDHMEKDAEPGDDGARVLSGLPASRGRYRGPCRVILSAEDFGRVQRGDVLVAKATMPAYNVLLPLVGAIVTDRGGALCHAAIVSREYGLPCVVGTREASARLADGDLVEVDGDAGTVTRV